MENTEFGCFCNINIENLQVLGEGRQGKVYLLTQDKVLKVFKKKHHAKDQLIILQHGYNSRFFPKVYEYDDYSIIMEFINGQALNEYLSNTSISEKISIELVELINEFKRLGFTRLDIRLAHIFVQADESIRIIDPRKNFEKIQPFPLLMIKGLEKNNALPAFFNYISCRYNEEFLEWKKQWEAYKLQYQ